MDNQSWDKAKLQEWVKFWESEMGQEALAKMRQIKNRKILESMRQTNAEAIAASIGRAAGIDLVLDDIQAGFDALEALGKEEKAETK